MATMTQHYTVYDSVPPQKAKNTLRKFPKQILKSKLTLFEMLLHY